ncbi:hypothetical protein [Rhizobium rhizogenes]|uniref:Putative transcriptional regulator with C-terminal CBS domain-containing protein n=1 Tax=Rhizobium rhizogenes TaxID=359 RepID=A0A7S5DRZ3_RHIRH|nr:hypothetical protein [Rhizobium rhizogenes]QCL10541.1 putative transcriptional regulator with C-terminal CBS domain-containing protein [Rhizobium rhizogenes]
MDDLDKLINDLPADEQRAIAKRADELITALNFRELRACWSDARGRFRRNRL